MKNFMTIIIILASSSLWVACSGTDTESVILQAESDLQTGNAAMAASGCELLTDTANNDLTFSQMCRVAIIYAKVSEMTDDHHYMITATECYDRAVDMADTDSLESYIVSLDLESQNVVSSIREVSQALKSPQEVGHDYEESEEYFDPLQNPESRHPHSL